MQASSSSSGIAQQLKGLRQHIAAIEASLGTTSNTLVPIPTILRAIVQSDHLTGSSEHFVSYILCVDEKIRIIDGSLAPIVEKEQISLFDGFSLHNVLHVPRISYNLLSIRKITHELNCKATFLPDSISFEDLSSGWMIGPTQHNRGLYLLDDDASSSSISRMSLLSSYFTTSEKELMLWHFHLGEGERNVHVWSANPSQGFSSKSLFSLLLDPSPTREFVFYAVWRIKVCKKVRFFTWQVLLDRANIVDRLVRRGEPRWSSNCCILCRKAKEDLDHLLWDCQYARAVWGSFLQEFDVRLAGLRTVRKTIEEFLLIRSVSLFGFSNVGLSTSQHKEVGNLKVFIP
ncbi:reverse transcriptase [Cucumis melo var. makuwa]|uniref:Reverse transcriptase n=1 Tax=Cucumis melo var. makuwa TaxID=1194695 RepID=A0A5D3E255_CUCMM|nr:reverse transcriptase [Cucumis melo var. makuwa]